MEPKIVKDWSRSHLLGLVELSFWIEDRTPGEEGASRYKNFLKIKIVRFVYSWSFRTQYLYQDLPIEGRE